MYGIMNSYQHRIPFINVHRHQLILHKTMRGHTLLVLLPHPYNTFLMHSFLFPLVYLIYHSLKITIAKPTLNNNNNQYWHTCIGSYNINPWFLFSWRNNFWLSLHCSNGFHVLIHFSADLFICTYGIYFVCLSWSSFVCWFLFSLPNLLTRQFIDIAAQNFSWLKIIWYLPINFQGFS